VRRILAALLAASAIVLALGQVPASAAVSHAHSATWTAWHYAQSRSGDPYVWAAAGPGAFDCSGLVMAAYRDAGIQLPHNTVAMLDSGKLIPTSHPTTGVLAFYGSGHVELFVRPGVTYGAQKPGTAVGYHAYNAFWHPTAYFRVAGAG
jgi:peptidoglycan DL-endopeptidase CwlO